MISRKKINMLYLRLECILREYLRLHQGDYPIKCDVMANSDWVKPISFVLGHKYAYSTTQETRDNIKNFLDNEFRGINILNLIDNSEYYCITNPFEYIEYIIEKINTLLSSN